MDKWNDTRAVLKKKKKKFMPCRLGNFNVNIANFKDLDLWR